MLGVIVSYSRNCCVLPLSRGEDQRNWTWWMPICPTFLLSPTTSTGSSVQPRTEPSLPTRCVVSSCPSQWTHDPDRLLHKKLQMQQQCHKKSLTAACTPQKTSIFSASADDFGPSCTRHLCYVTSPVYCWGEPPGICRLIQPQCRLPGCSLVQLVVPSGWSEARLSL